MIEQEEHEFWQELEPFFRELESQGIVNETDEQFLALWKEYELARSKLRPRRAATWHMEYLSLDGMPAEWVFVPGPPTTLALPAERLEELRERYHSVMIEHKLIERRRASDWQQHRHIRRAKRAG